MQTLQTAPNPFVLMLDPQAVFAAIEHSGRLARLNSRICRPLDKPLGARPDDEAAAFDSAVDQTADVAERGNTAAQAL